MRKPQVSIIIPTYNEEERLDDLLEFLRKNGGDFLHEIIIADGGSTDQTLRIAGKHNVIIKHCARKGRAVQMNEGAGEAEGSILYFLHADTTPPKLFLRHIIKAVRQGYRCGCFRLSFDVPHPILKFYAWFTRFPSTLIRFGDQSLFVEKKLFERVHGFDESLVVMEDQKIVRELKRESPFRIIEASVTTSARRYQENGIIRLQCVFTLIVLMYYCGAGQNTLVHVYNAFTKSEN